MARNHYSFRLKYHMPYYWSQIETLENLQYVAGLVDGFNQDRFLAALMGKRSVGKDKIEAAKQKSDLNEAARLQYGELPRLQQQLAGEEAALKNKDLSLVHESVGEEEIARYRSMPQALRPEPW